MTAQHPAEQMIQGSSVNYCAEILDGGTWMPAIGRTTDLAHARRQAQIKRERYGSPTRVTASIELSLVIETFEEKT